jgi:hypothetical protein
MGEAMSRKYCLFAPLFPEAAEFDCKRHRHLSAKEVEQGIDKTFRYFDLSPRTHLPRYVELLEHERSDNVDPAIVQNTQRTHIAEDVMRNAAGAFRLRNRKGSWTDAGSKEAAARDKVAAYGADRREFSRIVADERLIELRNFAWNENEVTADFRSRAARGSMSTPRGGRLRVALKARTPNAMEAALGYWKFFNLPLLSIVPDGNAKDASYPLKGAFPADARAAHAVNHVVTKIDLRAQAAALAKIDQTWSQIVAGFQAGPHSDEINSTPASELPSSLFREVLRAYLNIPSGTWVEIGEPKK